MTKIIASVIATLLLAGCAAGPDYRRPEMELPQAWQTPAPQALRADSVEARWWLLYADPVLERLEQEALAHNADLQVAAARVLEARARSGLADSDRYPAVSANAGGNRSQSTLEGAFPRPPDLPRIQNTFRATLDVSYEVDFWGKYSRASEAARAELLATEAAREAVLLSLTAQVAQQYFALLAADEQEAVVRRTLITRGETLALFRKRLEAGAIAEYALRQSEAEEAAARAQLAAFVQAKDQAEGALALLLGRSPGEVLTGGMERGSPSGMREVAVPAGLPSELLLRRPDLKQAEQGLIAANARIGAARAQYFPALGLTAYLGSESVTLANLFTGPAGIFQFAVALSQPIWNADRIGHNVEIAQARRDQALAQYRQAVASAFKDVRDALSAQSAARETLSAENDRIAALEQALKQAGLRFDAGIASRLDVLDAERNLLQAQLNRIDAQRARRTAVVGLFKALGGSWRDL